MRDFVPDEFIPEPDAVQGIPVASLDDRIPEDLVDAFFDGELDEQDSREFIRELRKDATTAKQVVSTNSSLEALRRPVSTPDFTSSIIRTVEGKTPLLSGREFSLVSHWRAVAAVCFLCLMTAAFVTQRVAPGASFTAQQTPLSRITESMPDAASEIGQTLNASFTAAQQFVTEQPEPVACNSSQTWCFTTLSETFLGCDSQNDPGALRPVCVEPAKPACIGECGAMQSRTVSAGFSAGIVGVGVSLHAHEIQSGTVIIPIK